LWLREKRSWFFGLWFVVICGMLDLAHSGYEVN
jgi:hypothetical protein